MKATDLIRILQKQIETNGSDFEIRFDNPEDGPEELRVALIEGEVLMGGDFNYDAYELLT